MFRWPFCYTLLFYTSVLFYPLFFFYLKHIQEMLTVVHKEGFVMKVFFRPLCKTTIIYNLWQPIFLFVCLTMSYIYGIVFCIQYWAYRSTQLKPIFVIVFSKRFTFFWERVNLWRTTLYCYQMHQIHSVFVVCDYQWSGFNIWTSYVLSNLLNLKKVIFVPNNASVDLSLVNVLCFVINHLEMCNNSLWL